MAANLKRLQQDLDASTTTFSSLDQDSDLSSALSSLSSSESELSALDDDETSSDDGAYVRPTKRIRRRAAELEIAEIESDYNSDDEDASGAVRAGHKKYLLAGLYAKDRVTSQAGADGREQEDAKPPLPLESIPLAVPAEAPLPVIENGGVTILAKQPEVIPLVVRRGTGQRASSIQANTKFARNGRGLSNQSAVTHLIRKKPMPRQIRQDSPPYNGPVERSFADPEAYNGPLLPLPINFGQVLIEREREFGLPFDIRRDFRQHGPGRLRVLQKGGRGKRPAKFLNLAKNVYPERNKQPASSSAICHCLKGSTCGEDCINRLMLYLCSTKLCPARHTCTNLPLNERDPLSTPDGEDGVQVFWTGNRGFGLRTKVDVKAGDFIMEYTGEVISRDESYRRVLDVYKDRTDFYFLDYDGNEVVDAGLKGSLARFVNHSCDPNCKMIRFRLADFDEWQIGLFAIKDFKAGTELSCGSIDKKTATVLLTQFYQTDDYGWVNFASLTEDAEDKARQTETDRMNKDKARQRCHCGADTCSGYLGGKKKAKR